MTATVGILNGTLLKVYVNGVAVAKTTSHTLNTSMSTRDITTKDSAGWKEGLEGLREWSIDGDFLQSEDAAYGYQDLFAHYTNRTKVTLKFTSSVSADVYYQGSAYLTSLSREAPLEDNVSGSFSFEGTGVLSEKTLT